MKKIILSTVAVLAVLWVAVFVSGQQMLVWEESVEIKVENLFDCFDEGRVLVDKSHLKIDWDDETEKKEKSDKVYRCRTSWKCTYFNGRRLITKEYSSSRTSCPNFRENR